MPLTEILALAKIGIDLIADAYRAAQAANDAEAIAALDATLADHEIGRRIAARSSEQIAAIGAAREGLPVE